MSVIHNDRIGLSLISRAALLRVLERTLLFLGDARADVNHLRHDLQKAEEEVTRLEAEIAELRKDLAVDGVTVEKQHVD